jgi:putative hemolysin
MESDNGDSQKQKTGFFATFLKHIGAGREEDITQEELVSMVNESHEQGVLAANEAEMINNIFEFDDKQASEIMTHRKAIDAIDMEMTLGDAMAFIVESTNSRFPVYKDDIDDIVGVLLIKDALSFYLKGTYNDTPISAVPGLLRKCSFIPETRKINTLFKNMQSQKIHMVIVVDEYGQTVGLITMEDILEEIVGNIEDEFDEEEVLIRRIPEGFILDGLAPLEEVCEALGMEQPEEEFETINGLLIALLDRIPEEKEKPVVEYGGWQFRVILVDNKMIKTVKAVKISEDAAEHAAAHE